MVHMHYKGYWVAVRCPIAVFEGWFPCVTIGKGMSSRCVDIGTGGSFDSESDALSAGLMRARLVIEDHLSLGSELLSGLDR